MSEDNNKDNNIVDVVKIIENPTIASIAGKVYEDSLKGGMQEVGKSITTLAKTINICLAPVSAMVWGYDAIVSNLKKKLEVKLNGVDTDTIDAPPIEVAGPAIEALRFSSSREDLQDMFASIIAKSMLKGSDFSLSASFIEIVKQLSPTEASFLNQIAFLREQADDKLLSMELEGLKITDFRKGILMNEVFSLVDERKKSEGIYTDSLNLFNNIYDKVFNPELPYYPMEKVHLENLERLKILNIGSRFCQSNESQHDGIPFVFGGITQIVYCLEFTDFGLNFLDAACSEKKLNKPSLSDS